jgi:hypothetical protein
MKSLISFIVCVVIFTSCEKESKKLSISDININESGTIIKYGLIRGWAMGNDSLIIESNDMWFISNFNADNSTIIQHQLIQDSEMDTLLNSLDVNEFLKIASNSADICPDCAEYWISLENDTLYHRIHYDHTDSESIGSIRNFVDKLEMLKNRFN